MTGKTHMICGVSTYVYLMATIPVVTSAGLVASVAGLAGSAMGSYLPDIDLASSKAGQKAPWISKLTSHRGITHTLLFPAIIAALAWYTYTIPIPILPTFLFGLIVGWVAHIVADLFNSVGVPILWPIVRQKIHIASLKTDNNTHQVLFIVLWEVVLICLLLAHWGILNPTGNLSL